MERRCSVAVLLVIEFAVASLCFGEQKKTASTPPAVSGASDQSSTKAARQAWPKQSGVYIASSSETIPPFPRALSGYRSEEGKDFWNKPISVRGSIRVFKDSEWDGIPNFPSTMNGCSAGVFMIRWRSANSSVPVQSSVRFSSRVASSHPVKNAEFGYMSGTNCEQPMFKFVDTLPHGSGTLVDIYYELKFWQAAP